MAMLIFRRSISVSYLTCGAVGVSHGKLEIRCSMQAIPWFGCWTNSSYFSQLAIDQQTWCLLYLASMDFRIWSSTPAINDLEGFEFGAWWKTSGSQPIHRGLAPVPSLDQSRGSLQWLRRGRVLSPWFWRGRGVGREESFRGPLQGKLGVVLLYTRNYLLVGGWKQGHGTTRWHGVVIKSFLTWLFVWFFVLVNLYSYFEKVAVWSAICTLFIWYLVLCLFPNLGCKTSAWLL